MNAPRDRTNDQRSSRPPRPGGPPPRRSSPAVAPARGGVSSGAAKWIAWAGVGAAVGTVVLLVAISFFLKMRGGEADEPEQIIAELTEQAALEPSPNSLPSSDDRITPKKLEPKPKETRVPDAPGAKKNDNPPPAEKPREDRVDENDALADFRLRKSALALPPATLVGGADKPHEIAKVYASAEKCQLELLGVEEVLGVEWAYELKPQDAGVDSRQWTVVLAPKVPGGKASPVGVFALNKRSLGFHWASHSNIAAQAEGLVLCVLSVTVGQEKESCTLHRPQPKDGIALPWGSSDLRSPIPAPKSAWRLSPAIVKLNLQLNGFPQHRLEGRLPLEDRGTLCLRFPDPEEIGSSLLELQVAFEWRPQSGAALIFLPAAYPKFLQDDMRVKSQREPITPATLERWRDLAADGKVKRFETEQRKIEAEIKRLQRHLEQNQAEREKVEKQQFNLGPSPSVAPGSPAARQQAVNQRVLGVEAMKLKLQGDELSRQMAQRKTDLARIDKVTVHFRKANQWCERVAGLIEEIRSKGRFEFLLYAEIAGRQVHLARSRRFAEE